jgi:hypothetical protein
MKQLFLFLLFSTTLNVSFPQKYHRIIELNKFWDEAGYNQQVICYFYPNRYEFIEGDSLINGHYYRLYKVYPLLGDSTWYGAVCPPFIADTSFMISASIREDTLTQKVYYYNQYQNPTDQLLYDFSISPGDTLFSPGEYRILDSIVDIVLFNGEIRKKFCFNDGCYYIEGIGGSSGLFHPLTPDIVGGCKRFCVKQNGIDLLGTQCNIKFLGMTDINAPSVSVYPNPIIDLVTINLINSLRPISFEVFTSNGIKVFSTGVDHSPISISLDNLKPGFYIYVFYSETIYQKGKLVKL